MKKFQGCLFCCRKRVSCHCITQCSKLIILMGLPVDDAGCLLAGGAVVNVLTRSVWAATAETTHVKHLHTHAVDAQINMLSWSKTYLFKRIILFSYLIWPVPSAGTGWVVGSQTSQVWCCICQWTCCIFYRSYPSEWCVQIDKLSMSWIKLTIRSLSLVGKWSRMKTLHACCCLIWTLCFAKIFWLPLYWTVQMGDNLIYVAKTDILITWRDTVWLALFLSPTSLYKRQMAQEKTTICLGREKKTRSWAQRQALCSADIFITAAHLKRFHFWHSIRHM